MSVTTTKTRAAARSVNLVKVYGEGDAAVTALDGVAVEFPAGQFSAITSVMGAVLGLGIGVLFGGAIVQALSDEGIESLVVPFGTLLSYVLLAAIAGVFAALGPARKAAKLDILQAIGYE